MRGFLTARTRTYLGVQNIFDMVYLPGCKNQVSQLLGAATGAKWQPAPRGLQESKEWQE